MPLPKQFDYLSREPGPKMLLAALADYGLWEIPGPANNPRIMQMAKNVGAASYYGADSIAWCALGVSDWCRQAGFALPNDPLAALSWAKFGTAVDPKEAMLGDVAVKARVGGGHVGIIVGETAAHFALLGANQGDSVCIAWFPKASFSHIRRSPWRIAQPANVRKIVVGASGPVNPVSEA